MNRYQIQRLESEIAIVDTLKNDKVVTTKASVHLAAVACNRLNKEYKNAINRFPLKANRKQFINS